MPTVMAPAELITFCKSSPPLARLRTSLAPAKLSETGEVVLPKKLSELRTVPPAGTVSLAIRRMFCVGCAEVGNKAASYPRPPATFNVPTPSPGM